MTYISIKNRMGARKWRSEIRKWRSESGKWALEARKWRREASKWRSKLENGDQETHSWYLQLEPPWGTNVWRLHAPFHQIPRGTRDRLNVEWIFMWAGSFILIGRWNRLSRGQGRLQFECLWIRLVHYRSSNRIK